MLRRSLLVLVAALLALAPVAQSAFAASRVAHRATASTAGPVHTAKAQAKHRAAATHKQKPAHAKKPAKKHHGHAKKPRAAKKKAIHHRARIHKRIPSPE